MQETRLDEDGRLAFTKHSISSVLCSDRYWSPSSLASHGKYQLAFAVLLIPALICLAFLLVARGLYRKPQDMEIEVPRPSKHAGCHACFGFI